MDVPAFIIGFGGVYCGTDGVRNVKFVIWTDKKNKYLQNPYFK